MNRSRNGNLLGNRLRGVRDHGLKLDRPMTAHLLEPQQRAAKDKAGFGQFFGWVMGNVQPEFCSGKRHIIKPLQLILLLFEMGVGVIEAQV